MFLGVGEELALGRHNQLGAGGERLAVRRADRVGVKALCSLSSIDLTVSAPKCLGGEIMPNYSTEY